MLRPAARIPIVLACVGAVALPGCGGSGSSDTDQVGKAVTGFYDALIAKNGPKACGELTPAFKAKSEAAFSVVARRRITCEAYVSNPPLETSDAPAKVSDIKVSGDTATVKIVRANTSASAQLRKIEGKWKIASIGRFHKI
jgi:hypothetical protein